MSQRKCPRPCLELLEDRSVPASIRFDGSNLFISNLNVVAGKSALTVAQLDSGAFQVKDRGAANGTYTVSGNLIINGGNASSTFAVTLNKGPGGKGSLPGNLNLRAGNGNDTVNLTTTNNGGLLAGNLSVNVGRGADFIGVDAGGAGAPSLAINGSVQVSGQAGAAQLPPGSPALVPAHSYLEFGQNTVPGRNTFIGGNVTIQGITDIKLGYTDQIGAQTFAGNVNIQLAANGPAFFDGGVSLGPNYNNYVTLSVSSKVLGNVNIQATSGDNFILADSSVGGSLTTNLGPGNNVLDLNFNANPGSVYEGPMNVGKDLTFTAGNGNNTLILDTNGAVPPDALDVQGNFSVNLGNGNNTYTFLQPTPGNVNVFGNLSFMAGNGTNAIPFVGTVYGNESYQLGNGSNTVTLTTAPGGTVSYNGGNGSNALTLDNGAETPQFYVFNALFGNGPNTFTIADTSGGGTTVSGQALGGSGTNTFVQSGDARIGSPFYLRNFNG